MFAAPLGIAVVGNTVFVTNYTNTQTSSQNGIRSIDATTGTVTTQLGYPASTSVANLMGQKPGLLNPDNSGSPLAAKSMNGGVVFVPQGLAANADGDLVVSTPFSIYQLVAPGTN